MVIKIDRGLRLFEVDEVHSQIVSPAANRLDANSTRNAARFHFLCEAKVSKRP